MNSQEIESRAIDILRGVGKPMLLSNLAEIVGVPALDLYTVLRVAKRSGVPLKERYRKKHGYEWSLYEDKLIGDMLIGDDDDDADDLRSDDGRPVRVFVPAGAAPRALPKTAVRSIFALGELLNQP